MRPEWLATIDDAATILKGQGRYGIVTRLNRLRAALSENTVDSLDELDAFLESAATGDGVWRPGALFDEEGGRRRRDTIWLTDDDGCSLQVDESDVALMVAALRRLAATAASDASEEETNG